MVRTPKSGFKYESDPDAIEKALAEIGGGNFFKAKEGKNIIRILPPYSDSGKFFFKATLFNGFKNAGKFTAIPVDGPAGAYISKKLNELASEGEEGAKLSRRYGARTKYFMNIIERDSGAVKIWGVSEKIMKQLKAFYLDEVDGGALDHPTTGRDVIIERSGKGMSTSYEIRFRPRQTPALEAGQDVPELFDLEEEVIHEFTLAEAKDIWTETFSGEDEAPKKARTEDDDDDAADDDDDQDDAPKSTGNRRRNRDEDEEEPLAKKSRKSGDDDDDLDEEAPRKSRRAKEDDEEPKPAPRRTRR